MDVHNVWVYLNDEMIVSFPPSLVPKRVSKDHHTPHQNRGISRPIRGHVFVLLDGRRPGYKGVYMGELIGCVDRVG